MIELLWLVLVFLSMVGWSMVPGMLEIFYGLFAALIVLGWVTLRES
jgi:hypothetical protein